MEAHILPIAKTLLKYHYRSQSNEPKVAALTFKPYSTQQHCYSPVCLRFIEMEETTIMKENNINGTEVTSDGGTDAARSGLANPYSTTFATTLNLPSVQDFFSSFGTMYGEWETRHTPPLVPGATGSPESTKPLTVIITSLIVSSINGFSGYIVPCSVLILLMLYLYGIHILSLVIVLCTFGFANSRLMNEIKKKNQRNVLDLTGTVTYVVIWLWFVFYMYKEQNLGAVLFFSTPNLNLGKIWTVLWLIVMTDHTVKLITIGAKIVVLSLTESTVAFRKKANYYSFIEKTSQLYRSILAFYPWLLYFQSKDEDSQSLFLRGLPIIYCLHKLYEVLRKGMELLQNIMEPMEIWTTPTETELSEPGQKCAICIRAAFVHPKRLSCSHIFCEECISLWFDKENSCPVCRVELFGVKPYHDGSTTATFQLF